jgi:hypothetical protein
MWLPAMLLCAKGNGTPFSSFQKKEVNDVTSTFDNNNDL